jgi:uncharacterized protein YpmB
LPSIIKIIIINVIIIRIMKSRRMIWSGHVTPMEEKRNAYATRRRETTRKAKTKEGGCY